jgi:hypothetical protein
MEKIVVTRWKMNSEEAILVDRLLKAVDLFCDSQEGCDYCPLSKCSGCALDDLNDILGNIRVDPVNEEHYNNGVH